ncbi:MAG: bifunctional phosphopantothenoylcysteine decarboxylase/phosphopantothenate--cysteine ligase CoaBC [Acidobacteriota bacterium]
MKVVLGVTGGISAYKAVEVMRGLQKSGVEVQVVMTKNATRMVTPLTFQSISGYPVIDGMWTPTHDPEIKHIELAQNTDLILVAPATANILAKFANGIADDFLTTLYISATAPVLVAPAMNVEMWAHPATQENVEKLRKHGVLFVDPESGYLACKTVGPGRLAEPQQIVQKALEILGKKKTSATDKATYDLLNENILITAGPTYEAIDPVRGITNRSSGKMGYAIAEAARRRGAKVTLITGPVNLSPPSSATTIQVKSAAEMYDAVMQNLAESTMIIMAAAVADYTPAKKANHKIKKGDGKIILELEPTKDILAAVGRVKDGRVLIGFAAETENVEANARKKLINKKADLIVANDVSRIDSGFEVNSNQVSLISLEETINLELLPKMEVAEKILDSALIIKQSNRIHP